MKKRHYLYFIFSFIFILNINAQKHSFLNTTKQVLEYNKMPQERIFVHYNTSLLFVGEYLYYKVYCKNNKNNLLSKISKIAYIELIDEKKQLIFKHKIKLENGSSQGDFFVPVSIPSGNYKLIGYTQWMLNSEKANFFLGDISIINPYQSDQKLILKDQDTLKISSKRVAANKQLDINVTNNNSEIKILIERNSFQKRSLVKLKVDRSKFKEGEYSISVRKKHHFLASKLMNSEAFENEVPKVNTKKKNINESIFLPEIRGEIIYGKLISNDSSSIDSRKIGVSTYNIKDKIDIVSTDKEGSFIFHSDKKNKENSIVFQVLENDKKKRFKYKFNLIEFPEFTYPDMEFYDFIITPEFEKEIINRSIYNQIENIYYNVKPDTIQKLENKNYFYGDPDETYYLDDYTRFSTIKETTLEFIDGLSTRRNNKGERVFSIKGIYSDQRVFDFAPLIIFDGVVIQEQEEVMDYDARKVKSISYIKDRYYIGTEIYQGILIIETIKGDHLLNDVGKYYTALNLMGIKKEKKYFIQRYDNSKTSYNRVPDYRNQLFWNPNLSLSENITELEFFTSDVIGKYEISLEGFSRDGNPISIKEYFIVN